jgi:hypothetical protein
MYILKRDIGSCGLFPDAGTLDEIGMANGRTEKTTSKRQVYIPDGSYYILPGLIGAVKLPRPGKTPGSDAGAGSIGADAGSQASKL